MLIPANLAKRSC